MDRNGVAAVLRDLTAQLNRKGVCADFHAFPKETRYESSMYVLRLKLRQKRQAVD